MVQRTFSDNADDCRRFAEEVDGEPDKACLHRIAHEFDRLADEVRFKDRSYYAVRASQEVAAAVRARHPKARIAHLLMAQRYDAIARGSSEAH